MLLLQQNDKDLELELSNRNGRFVSYKDRDRDCEDCKCKDCISNSNNCFVLYRDSRFVLYGDCKASPKRFDCKDCEDCKHKDCITNSGSNSLFVSYRDSCFV